MANMEHSAITLGNTTTTGSERKVGRLIAYVASGWFLIVFLLQALAD
jgi:hypothetical protein